MPDPGGALIDAMHKYIDEGGDTDTLVDSARMVAQERQDDMDERDAALEAES